MWEWLDGTIVVAMIGAAGLILQHLINRAGKKEELSATERDNLILRLGEQVDRLEVAQLKDRRRIDWLEDEVWAERHQSNLLHRLLTIHTDWGEVMVRWAKGDRVGPYPAPPDWAKARQLLASQRPRRPPPTGGE